MSSLNNLINTLSFTIKSLEQATGNISVNIDDGDNSIVNNNVTYSSFFSIPTTGQTALPGSGITVSGCVYVKNLDSTGIVNILVVPAPSPPPASPNPLVFIGTLFPGDIYIWWANLNNKSGYGVVPGLSNIYVQALTAGTVIEYLLGS